MAGAIIIADVGFPYDLSLVECWVGLTKKLFAASATIACLSGFDIRRSASLMNYIALSYEALAPAERLSFSFSFDPSRSVFDSLSVKEPSFSNVEC